MECRIQVTAEEDGQRIDKYLAAAFPDLSRSYIQRIIRDGGVRILKACEDISAENQSSVKNSYEVREDDLILLDVPELKEPDILPENIPLDVLYEDDSLLIVNKPKGMVVHPAPGHSSGTLVNALLWHCHGRLSGINGILRPGIVHRIDRDTTGALVVCKTDSAHRALAEQLAVHSITRCYRTILTGRLPEETMTQPLTVSGNIGRSTADRKKMAVVPEGKGKPAVTHIRTLQNLRGYTYAECTLETGRTHQIRVHAASIGHPVLGDPLYGPKRCPVPNLEGQVLHAMKLGFIHPVTGEYMEFTAPLPAYFEKLLKQLA